MEKLDFKPISFEDKALFDRYLKKYPQRISELTFTNLFVFRESKKTEFCEFEGHLIVSFEKEGKRVLHQPVGEFPERIIEKILDIRPGIVFERVDSEIAKKLDNSRITRDRDMDDYVYRITDLIELSGQRYASKRNFITRFLTQSPEVREIDEKAIEACLSLTEEWCNLKDCKKDKALCAEYLAIKDALNYFSELKLFGIIIMVDGRVVGFAIGEPLGKNTFVEHFEKANDKFTGAYQFLLNEFCKRIPTNFTFLNREQDLGVPGLRKSKESYYPAKMIEKNRVSGN